MAWLPTNRIYKGYVESWTYGVETAGQSPIAQSVLRYQLLATAGTFSP
jgi:hypothetical protein